MNKLMQPLARRFVPGPFFVDTRAVPDLPLCSGLTLAQQIQRIRAAAFPEDQRKADEARAAMIARGRSTVEAEPDIALPVAAPPLPKSVKAQAMRPAVKAPAARPAPRAKPKPSAPRQRAVAEPARSSFRHFSSCREARAAGAAPIRRGQPGYSGRLDRDGDGIACE